MMITAHDAINAIRDAYPELHITQVIDYDERWFVICAIESFDKVNYDSPYYAVNKRTGAIHSFTPMADLEKFIEASRNRTITFD